MADTNTPRGWNFNPTNIGVILSLILFFFAVVGSIAGAAWYMSAQAKEIESLRKDFDAVKQASYEKGKTDAEKRQNEVRIETLEKELKIKKVNEGK